MSFCPQKDIKTKKDLITHFHRIINPKHNLNLFQDALIKFKFQII